MVRIELLKKPSWQNFYCLFKKMIQEDFLTLPGEGRQFFSQGQYGEKKLKESFIKDRVKIFVAKNQGRVQGFVVFTKVSGGVMIVNWLAVVKNLRGRGIGPRLLKKVESCARKQGFHKLNLVTANPQNVIFYQKCGFTQEGFKQNDRWGRDRYLFGKVLGQYVPKK